MAGIRRGGGVAGQAGAVRRRVQVGRELAQDRVGVVLHLGAAAVEHWAILRIDDLNAQAFGGDVEEQLILEWLQCLALADGFRQILHERFEVLVLLAVVPLLSTGRRCRRGRGDRRRLRRRDGCNGYPNARLYGVLHRARRIKSAAQIDRACARAARAVLARRGLHTLAGLHAGVLEVFKERGALFFGPRRAEPHHEEERHHGRHEIRVRDLPCAAVMAALVALLALDDDDGAFGLRHAERPYAALAGGLLLPFRCASRSLKVGRTSLKRSLRANSTATGGA